MDTSNILEKYNREAAVESSEQATRMYAVWVNALDVPEKLPFVQSGAWARQGNKLLLIGGIIGGFHGLSQLGGAFTTTKANKSIWVIDLSDFSYSELPLKPSNPFYFQFSSSNMQFCREDDMLYIAGGFGVNNITDTQSNYTFDKIVSIQVSEMIRQVELQGNGDPNKAIISSASSPFLQVTGGEMVKVKDTFYLMFGQNYGGVYQPGQTGNYTNSIRKFRFAQGQVTDYSSYTNAEILHRRDLPMAPIIVQNGTFYAAFGGVFTGDDNGYVNPVYIHINNDGTFSAQQDSMLIQKTNQYKCAKASFYNPLTGTNTIVLFGGIGRYQYNTTTHQWEDGDDGAKLPFVKTITQMIFQRGFMKQYIQIPPLYPELPDYIGANANFFANTNFLYSEGVIDHSKLPAGISSVGILYGGIKSLRPTSSAIYPTSINTTIYEVFAYKFNEPTGDAAPV